MAKNNGRRKGPKAQAPEMVDPLDYHYDELARRSILDHPEVKRRIDTTKQRLRDAAILPDDETIPPRGRRKAAVQVPRNVKAAPAVKDVTASARARPIAQGSGKTRRGSRSSY